MPVDPVAQDLRVHLRARLRSAMRTRDSSVGVLRSAIAALDNAEAIEVGEAPGPQRPPASGPHVAGARAGLGAGDADRRTLTVLEQRILLEGEIAARRATADDLDRRGQSGPADNLRIEAGTLAAILAAAEESAPPT